MDVPTHQMATTSETHIISKGEVRSNGISAEIVASESSLQEAGQQNKHLLANVETVNGSISLEWISLVGILELYIPRSILWLMSIGIIILGYYSLRRHPFEMS